MEQLDLLRDLFTEIHIPHEVYDEVVNRGVGKSGEAEVRGAQWIKKQPIINNQAVTMLSTILGEGEAACIVLAMTMKADLVILDDRIGRLYAQAQGLRITGTIGILLTAAERSRVDFRQALDDLLATGFRLSPQEYERIVGLWQKRRQTGL